MKVPIRAFWLLAAVFIAASGASAQDPNIFTSGDGGFAIDISRAGVSVADKDLKDPILTGSGKTYTWEKPGEYYYEVGYYKMDRKLTAREKTAFLEAFKRGFLGEMQKQGAPHSETPYTFQGNSGIQLKVIFPNARLIARFFATDTRFYFISTASANAVPEPAAVKILDSFRLLDAALLKAVKIEEATPVSPPQSPAVQRLTTDARDKNLKGKVKSVIEDSTELPGNLRERSSEEYYDAQGNLIKELHYLEDYPTRIILWGYIDGKRVSKWGYLHFEDDQRPPYRHQFITSSAGLSEDPKNPRDQRYTVKYDYKYDESGRLVEQSSFQNNGTPTVRTAYTFSANRRDERTFGSDGQENSHTHFKLDAAGNTIEQAYYNEKDIADIWTVYKYEFDATGNWTVQKAFNKKTVRRKVVLEPIWISYRTITYYP